MTASAAAVAAGAAAVAANAAAAAAAASVAAAATATVVSEAAEAARAKAFAAAAAVGIPFTPAAVVRAAAGGLLPLEQLVELAFELRNTVALFLDDELGIPLLLNQACIFSLFRNKSSDSGVSLH